jgi:hypothetical protein
LNRDVLLEHKIEKCPYRVIFIDPNSQENRRDCFFGVDRELVDKITYLWQRILHDRDSSLPVEEFTWEMDILCRRVFTRDPYWDAHIRWILNRNGEMVFLVMLEEEFRQEIQKKALSLLCNFWQIEHRFTPLHSSAIIHKGNLFVFCGSSGAGKSTISQMSFEKGEDVLDEDQIMIYQKPEGSFSANAWGYNLRSCSLDIRAIFKIIKSTEDRLIPLTHTQTAHLLADQSFTIPGKYIADRQISDLFGRISDIARKIPGFELHFRKAPDFWKVIDAEFGLE